ncbi:hypothetical protein E2C01_025333 [Portunus trituberculatus]|uniref:Uncharacterized protein n=1 Tax=Portunus trituberculatus TaxID=210409 RepID=A0A5B7ED05_PORTR|nr:hypothetical protein [Portunus trituberculatus]
MQCDPEGFTPRRVSFQDKTQVIAHASPASIPCLAGTWLVAARRSRDIPHHLYILFLSSVFASALFPSLQRTYEQIQIESSSNVMPHDHKLAAHYHSSHTRYSHPCHRALSCRPHSNHRRHHHHHHQNHRDLISGINILKPPSPHCLWW